MTIQPLGFLDTSAVTARLLIGKEQKARVQDGILRLRDFNTEMELIDLGGLREWNSARALLSRLRNAAAPFFAGVTPELGRAWIEFLPPLAATPWTQEIGDYAASHHRTRTALISCPGAMTYCGMSQASLLVGMVNVIDHNLLCAEANHGEHARVHLVVDVKIPGDGEP